MNGSNQVLDVFVVGGGINGTGIANDAAGRGLDVMLCEMNDLASATSSASSKLIHGGLRYLEYYEFSLVRKALAEREILLRNAPHIISPLKFYLPHRPHLRPSWMIRLGLFLYDNLSKRVSLSKSRQVTFSENSPLSTHITKGFEYADAWVDDARLTVLNAVSAQSFGAIVKTQTQLISAISKDGIWQLTVRDKESNTLSQVHAKVLVNAAGPWVEKVNHSVEQPTNSHVVRLVKGSHIVVPKLHDDEHAFILQNEDGRIVFVLPYQEKYTLIGTTDVEYHGDPSDVGIDQDETNYLIDITNQHFKAQISLSDILHTYSGVRPLMQDEADNPQAVSRDYRLELSQSEQQAPLLNIYGGKITTYRKLSEAAVDKLKRIFPNLAPSWTEKAALPGGDFQTREQLFNELVGSYPWLPASLLNRFVTTYGTRTHMILQGCESLVDLGVNLGAGLYQKELCYLVKFEFARELDDVIWRRTKLGLQLSKEQQNEIARSIREQIGESESCPNKYLKTDYSDKYCA